MDKKEKILSILLIPIAIAIFVCMFFWVRAIAKDGADVGLAILTFFVFFVFLKVNAMRTELEKERLVQRMTDKVMDAIIEFRKETIKDTEQKILKKINKK